MKSLKLVITGENKEPLSLTWTITNICNYRCSYCNAFHGKEFTQNYIEKIEEINEHRNLINRLLISGGEATLHPNIYDIFRLSKIPIRLWSNLHKDVSTYLKLKETNENFTELNVSFHPENTDFKIWSDKVKYLSKYFNIFCNIMHIEDKRSISQDLLSELSNYAKVNRGYLLDFYKKEPDRSLFSNELVCYINDKPYYFFDRNNLNFKTIAVDCDINKHRINLYLDKYYYCCNFREQNLNELLDKKIVCSNSYCSGMYLRRGIKKGLFVWIKDGIMR